MLRYSRSEVLGAHPLFGPEDAGNSGKMMIICQGRGERGLRWLSQILRTAEIKTAYLDPEEHDRKMGLIQGVNHLATLALALCIRDSGFSYAQVSAVSTETFRRRLKRIHSILDQPSTLFGSLLMDNPLLVESAAGFLSSVEGLVEMIRDRDKETFMRQFASLKEFFANDSGPAGTLNAHCMEDILITDSKTTMQRQTEERS
jgi:prephenate dehydrogenase